MSLRVFKISRKMFIVHINLLQLIFRWKSLNLSKNKWAKYNNLRITNNFFLYSWGKNWVNKKHLDNWRYKMIQKYTAFINNLIKNVSKFHSSNLLVKRHFRKILNITKNQKVALKLINSIKNQINRIKLEHLLIKI